MNYLAHSLLSCIDDDMLIGNLMADMTRNKELEGLDERILEGVKLHRVIDSFTDNHPAHRRSAHLLHERQGKYATVIVDIYYDYFLYHSWDKFCDMPFKDFKATVYHQIRTSTAEIPSKAKDRLLRMTEGDWLESYGTIEGLDYVFSRVAKRAKFNSNMATATQDLLEHKDLLQKDFESLFEDLQKEVNIICGC